MPPASWRPTTSPPRPRRRILARSQLASFVNEAGLEALGDNLFLETPASGQATAGNPNAAGLGTLRQGYLETSNVNPVQEIRQSDHRPARLRHELEGDHHL